MNAQKNVKDEIFYLIPIGVFITMILSWKFTVYYNIDSSLYIKLASSFPEISTSIFPISYPIALKVTNLILNNFDYTAKFINLLSVLFVFSFVKRKNFFWKEIWTMLTFSSFLNVFPFVWSETFLLPFLVLFSYVNYKILIIKTSASKLIFVNALIMFFMVTIKYNSLFIIFGTALFSLLLLVKNQRNLFIVYLKSLIFFAILISIYLFFNYFVTGSIMGARSSLKSMNYYHYFFYSFINVLPSLDPFFIALYNVSKKLKILLNLKYITFFPYLISYIYISYIFFKFWNRRLIKTNYYFKWLVCSGFIFLLCTFLSAYFTDIDTLGSRLLLAFYFFVLLSVIYYIKTYFANIINDKMLLILSFFSTALYILSILFNIRL